jgi:hypothetical protein
MSLFMNTQKCSFGKCINGQGTSSVDSKLTYNSHQFADSHNCRTIDVKNFCDGVEDQYTASRQLNMQCNWGMDVQ